MKRIDSARHMAVHLLGEFETREASLEHHLKCLQDSALTPLDRRFVRHLVLGTVRWRKRLDWIVDQFARRPISSCSPWIRQILRLGVYQIFWLDRIPDRAAVHTSVELARHFGDGGVVLPMDSEPARVFLEALVKYQANTSSHFTPVYREKISTNSGCRWAGRT